MLNQLQLNIKLLKFPEEGDLTNLGKLFIKKHHLILIDYQPYLE